jgi:hypothetical protein
MKEEFWKPPYRLSAKSKSESKMSLYLNENLLGACFLENLQEQRPKDGDLCHLQETILYIVFFLFKLIRFILLYKVFTFYNLTYVALRTPPPPLLINPPMQQRM